MNHNQIVDLPPYNPMCYHLLLHASEEVKKRRGPVEFSEGYEETGYLRCFFT